MTIQKAIVLIQEYQDGSIFATTSRVVQAQQILINSMADRLSEIHAWAVCAAIAPPNDLFENIERIVEVSGPDFIDDESTATS